MKIILGYMFYIPKAWGLIFHLLTFSIWVTFLIFVWIIWVWVSKSISGLVNLLWSWSLIGLVLLRLDLYIWILFLKVFSFIEICLDHSSWIKFIIINVSWLHLSIKDEQKFYLIAVLPNGHYYFSFLVCFFLDLVSLSKIEHLRFLFTFSELWFHLLFLSFL